MRLAFTNFSIKSPTGKKSGRFFLALFLGIFLFLTHPMLCQAGFASSTPFTGASWELVGEYPILGSNGAVQSVCATEDYIICIENFNDLTTEPDVVSAYYKNDTDADGNPVTQYSLAHQVRDADFAHANGMAYNPVTHEILVSGYSSPDASNYGCIFRLDPDTLEQKERIQLSTSYNILGIDYLPSTGGYLIQTDADGGYGFKLLDASLQVMDDWGTYPFDFYMENFQDLCVSGDLFFLFPLTMHLGIGNFIQTYSLSQKTLLADDTVDFGFSDDITINEPEDLCETNPGEFIAIVNVTKADGGRYVQFYRTRVPYLFTVSTSTAEHGSVSEGGEVSRGEEKTVSYTADEGFRLAKLSVDGLYLPVTEYPDSYTFSDIQKDHTLAVTFEPVPTATPTPTATATPTETPAITQTPEPAVSKAPASSTVSFSSRSVLERHCACRLCSRPENLRIFCRSRTDGRPCISFACRKSRSRISRFPVGCRFLVPPSCLGRCIPFCPYPEGRSCFSGDAVCPSRSDSALCPPPAVCPPHPAGAVAESAGTQKKNVRRTGQRIYGRSEGRRVFHR